MRLAEGSRNHNTFVCEREEMFGSLTVVDLKKVIPIFSLSLTDCTTAGGWFDDSKGECLA